MSGHNEVKVGDVFAERGLLAKKLPTTLTAVVVHEGGWLKVHSIYSDGESPLSHFLQALAVDTNATQVRGMA